MWTFVVLFFYNYTLTSCRVITEQDIDSQMMTSLGDSPPLDILVRTSGVKRLSDYLLWQVSICVDFTVTFF